MKYFNLKVSYKTKEVDLFGAVKEKVVAAKERVYAQSEEQAKSEIAYNYRKSGLVIESIK